MNLLKLEMMKAPERLAEAVQMRGIFVQLNGDVITLTKENTKQDIEAVRELITAIGIPVLWLDCHTFQLLVNRLPIAVMKRIINKNGREFPVGMQPYHFRWRAFAQRRFGIKVNALQMDAQVALLVKSLNYAGITCLAGCNGHHRFSPNVQLSGVYNGAWLEVIQELFFSGCELNYDWTVHYGNQSGASLIADKAESEKWNMNLIYQDTVKMALILQENAGQIRKVKKEAFKRGGETKRTAEKLVMDKHYKKLAEWMKTLVTDTDRSYKG